MDILLQILSDNLIPIIIFFVFLLLQYISYLRTQSRIKTASLIFPEEHGLVDESANTLQIAESEGMDIYNEVVDKINIYVAENKDSIDFHEMKDIANRLSDKEMEVAISTTATPMYLGLMGTYLGVAYGLFELVFSMAKASSRMFDSHAVYVFIGGVVVAMLTSLFGLIFTTMNNKYSSIATKRRDELKDTFFIFLQSKILPTYPSTLTQTLKKELKNSIKDLGSTVEAFDGTVKSLNTELKSAFQSMTSDFEEKMKSSLSGVQQVVQSLNDSAKAYSDAMRVQDNILKQMNSPAFTAVLKKINETVDKCSRTDYTISQIQDKVENIVTLQDRVERMQNTLIESQTALLSAQNSACDNVVRIEEKFSESERIFAYIENTLSQLAAIEKFAEQVTVNEFKDRDEKIALINQQLESIEEAGNTIKRYIDLQQQEIKNSGSQFVASWQNMFKSMEVNGNSNPLNDLRRLMSVEQKLEDIYALLQKQSDKPKTRNVSVDEPKKKRGLFGRIFRRK